MLGYRCHTRAEGELLPAEIKLSRIFKIPSNLNQSTIPSLCTWVIWGPTSRASRSHWGIRTQGLEAGTKKRGRHGLDFWNLMKDAGSRFFVFLVAVTKGNPISQGLWWRDVKEGMCLLGEGGSSIFLSSFPCWTSQIMSS